ncbi:MAG: TolC family protein [Salibacteraceae bacterium]
MFSKFYSFNKWSLITKIDRTRLLFLWLCIGCLLPSWGTSQVVLEAYVAEGLRQNEQLKQANYQVADSRLALQSANGLLMPTVEFGSSMMFASGGRQIEIPVGDLMNPVYSNLNELNGSNQFPMIENVSEPFLLNRFQDTRLRVVQPLFNSDIYYNRGIQKSLVEVAKAQENTQRQVLVRDIKTAYYSYLQAYEALDIYESNLVVLQEVVRFNQARFAENLVTQDEVLRSEYQVEQVKADLAQAKANRETAQSYFNFLLNRDYSEPILIDSGLSAKVDVLEAKVESGLAQRPEMAQLKAAREAQDWEYKMNRANQFLPKINAVGDVGYQGQDYKFDDTQDYWMINLGLSWELFSGYRRRTAAQRSQIAMDRLNSQQQQLESQIALEVVRSRTNLDAARQQLNARQRALQAAQRSYQVTESRYRESQVLLLEYLDAQTTLTTAQLELNISKYLLLAQLAELERSLASTEG